MEFCAAHGLSVDTVDAWRRSIADSVSEEKIVPVELVEDHGASMGSKHAASVERNGQFRILLADSLRIELDAGFDAAQLRPIAALDSKPLRNGLLPPV
jgi:hypothetical protein